MTTTKAKKPAFNSKLRNSRGMPKLIVRLPIDVKDWLARQSAENASSQSSEVVRAVRERMARCEPGTSRGSAR
jgi:hypothetical protein